MRILVTGGRHYADIATAREVLSAYKNEDVTIVQGGALGADTLCVAVAKELGFSIETHPADWGKYGNAAGPIRNQEMVDLGADMCIAFPGGRGTEDCLRKAEQKGINVLRV